MTMYLFVMVISYQTNTCRTAHQMMHSWFVHPDWPMRSRPTPRQLYTSTIHKWNYIPQTIGDQTSMCHRLWVIEMTYEIILEWYQTVVVQIRSWTGELLRKFIRWRDWRIEKDIELKIFITMELSDSRPMWAFLELGFIQSRPIPQPFWKIWIF